MTDEKAANLHRQPAQAALWCRSCDKEPPARFALL